MAWDDTTGAHTEAPTVSHREWGLAKQVFSRLAVAAWFMLAAASNEPELTIVGAVILGASTLPLMFSYRRRLARQRARSGRALEDRIAELEERHEVALLESEDRGEQRIQELESRLEFFERMMVQRKESDEG